MITRYAIVTNATSRKQLEVFLPDNYKIIWETFDSHRPEAALFVIEGKDNRGWGLNSYIMPRLASGNIIVKEIDLSHPIMKTIPMHSGGYSTADQ